jgi:RNA polymerase sigma-70 factor (ECF subfamily)
MKLQKLAITSEGAQAIWETTAAALDSRSVQESTSPRLPALAVEREVLQLYEDCSRGLLRYATALCRRPDIAQEAVQEAFLRYYVFRLRGQIHHGGITWLYKTARNWILDNFNQHFSKNSVDVAEALEVADWRQNPALEYERAELARRALDVLAPRELQCFRLRAEGLKYREIAEILEVEPGTVGALLARALRKIRQLFNHPPGEE